MTLANKSYTWQFARSRVSPHLANHHYRIDWPGQHDILLLGSKETPLTLTKGGY